ncbi:hypothetical protein [Furfurilactobacillus milii]|uniref:Nucleotidyl transferase AbiEii/AbiGii toxin family protein n=1 Tax=Furfurilactobacillus rossiae TaxID=231049 RepID=A0A7C9IVM2_9LACO|nr:hypothetical protein [Furfurilactobacillus milii]MYV06419.1 hypothetical protein [Furfurilactobacillus milii]
MSNDFFDTFADFRDQYVIIGGMAASIIMEQKHFVFRPTRDYDMVVFFELTTADFSKTLLRYLADKHYELTGIKEMEGSSNYYRFTLPKDKLSDGDYQANDPQMIELFSRIPVSFIDPHIPTHLIPLPYFGYTSLSAIVLDNNYYELIKHGVEIVNQDQPILRPEYLILFKMKAFLDIQQRHQAGEQINHRDLNKHLYDVIRLLQIVEPENQLDLENMKAPVKNDVQVFIHILEEMIDLNKRLTKVLFDDNTKLSAMTDKAEIINDLKQLFML